MAVFKNGIFYPEAGNFIIAAGLTDETQMKAINKLVWDLKVFSIWDKMKAIYPFVGQAGVSSSFQFNLKDPTAFKGTFNGTWAFASTGVTPTNGYINTGLNMSGVLTANNHHISLYSRTNSSADSIDSGVTDNAVYSFFQLQLPRFGSLTIQNGSQIVNTTFTNSLGLFTGTSTSTTLTKLYQNGGVIGTSTTLQTRALFNNNIYIGTSNVSTDNNPVGVYSAKQYAFATIGDGLTDTDAANLYIAVQRFQTTLGRQV